MFLRQSGLSEQFFALIKLALELNVSENKFNKIQPNETEQDTLIEYEEVILKSGLPMNEIWLRIEKLRQNFYFLPCPSDRTCSDPQRIIFNEDIFHYVYPLSNREFSFHLVITILRLLKVPLWCHGQKDTSTESSVIQSNQLWELDNIEELMPLFLKNTINKPSSTFDTILCELFKDFSVGPSFIPTIIGHELYLNCIVEILLICSECFESYATKSRRNICLLLWLRLERAVVMVNKRLDKWTPEKEKRLRTKIKNLLKRDENRNCLILYTEYALIEYDCGRLDVMETVFTAAIANTTQEDDLNAWWATYVAYVEVLMREERCAKALNALTCLALGESIEDQPQPPDDVPSNSRILLALKRLNDRLGNLIYVERNVSIMEIEQYLLPDYLINVIKAKIYLLILWKDAKEVPVEQIEYLLKTFIELNPRHKFIRENLYEIFVNIVTYSSHSANDQSVNKKHPLISGTYVFGMLQRGFDEFPNNLVIARSIVMTDSQAWHKIRTMITQQHAPKTILLLVAGAIYRCKKYSSIQSSSADLFVQQLPITNENELENIYKMRICNMLRNITSKDSPTRKNSLIWRIYMRFLLDFREDFNKSRNTLLTALDECPWNKVCLKHVVIFLNTATLK